MPQRAPTRKPVQRKPAAKKRVRKNLFGLGGKSTHYTRSAGGKFQDVAEHGSVKVARKASIREAKAAKRLAAVEAKAAKRLASVEAAHRKLERKKADQANRLFLKRQKAEERRREKAKPAIQRKFEALRKKSASVPAKRRMSDKGILADLMRPNPGKRFTNLLVSLSDSKDLSGPFRPIPAYTPVSIVERGKGGHRFLVRADYFGKPAWGWVDKEYLETKRPNPTQRRPGPTQPYVRAPQKPAAKRRNSAASADQVFTDFHGYAPSQTVEVTERIHFHEHLAAAGRLVSLSIKPVDHAKPERTLKGFGKDCLLCFNEKQDQLFVKGGDQALSKDELAVNFGIQKPHELETLGRATDITYHTNKTHLGDEGGNVDYEHGFRMTNERGQHVVVKIARYPDVIYRVRDERLEFSGGSYFIRAEGIDK